MEENYLKIINEIKQDRINDLNENIELYEKRIRDSINYIREHSQELEDIQNNTDKVAIRYKKMLIRYYNNEHIHNKIKDKRTKEGKELIKNIFDEYSKCVNHMRDTLNMPHEVCNFDEFMKN